MRLPSQAMSITVTVNVEDPHGNITKYGTITSPHNAWVRPTLTDIDPDSVYYDRRLVAVSAGAVFGLVRLHAARLADDYPDEHPPQTAGPLRRRLGRPRGRSHIRPNGHPSSSRHTQHRH